jgi:hypothetical protein
MRKLVEDTLRLLEPEIKYTQDAANLLLGTAAQESAYGKFRKQIGGGPALGIFQMEPNTFKDIVENYLRYHKDIESKIKQICRVSVLNSIDLINNDRLAICFARVHYLRCKEAIPNTIEGYAQLWKKRYNTPLGAGTEKEFIYNYKFYVLKEPLV